MKHLIEVKGLTEERSKLTAGIVLILSSLFLAGCGGNEDRRVGVTMSGQTAKAAPIVAPAADYWATQPATGSTAGTLTVTPEAVTFTPTAPTAEACPTAHVK